MSNTEKSLEKSLGKDVIQGPEAQRKYYAFGELNAEKTTQDGKTLDPGNNSGLQLLADLAKERANPNSIDPDNFYGKWKAVVLRIEKPSLTAQSTEMQLNMGKTTLPLTRIKARIPEIDGFLPDPLTYGDNGDTVIIDVHKTFEAANTETREPAVGDIVWVEVTNLDDIDSAGTYTDVIFHAPVDGGAVGTSGNTGSGAFNKGNKLNAAAATGDGIAGLGPVGMTGQTPTPLQEQLDLLPPVPGINPPISDKQMAYEGKGKGSPGGPIMYNNNQFGPRGPWWPFRRNKLPGYRELGEVELTKWTNLGRGTYSSARENGQGDQKDVVAAAYPYLKLFSKALNEEFGVTLRVNSGFRTMAEQERLFNRYLRQVEQWKRRNKDKTKKFLWKGDNKYYSGKSWGWKTVEEEGKPPREVEKRPPPAAYPGRSNHQSGRAYDLKYYDKRGRPKKLYKGTRIFNWMIKNGPKYGFSWGEVKSEPWHWSFDINKAPPIAESFTEPNSVSDDIGQTPIDGDVDLPPMDNEQSVESPCEEGQNPIQLQDGTIECI